MALTWKSRYLFSLSILLSTVPPLLAGPNLALQRPFEAPFEAPFILAGQSDTEQVQSTARRIAIIGAGAAGSSTAYHLHQLSSNSSHSPNISITIFESHPHVGGRSTTVDVLDDPQYPAELGASIFSSKYNAILADVAQEFNLTTLGTEATRPSQGAKYGLGVWDGEEFVFKSSSDDGGEGVLDWLWDMVSLLWQYGLAPLKTRNLMQDAVAKFLPLYHEPFFPFTSLTEAAAAAGLLELTSHTGWEFLSRNGVGQDFAREIIQASTRVNYGQNLGLIHGLETMVCMATEGAVAVEGGNWRIFDGMVGKSGAEVRLNTSVQEIHRLSGGGYRIKSGKATEGRVGEGLQAEEDEGEAFDTVVLAAPYQFSGIDFHPSLPISHEPKSIPYVTLHVTLLTSPHRPSPKFFHREGHRSGSESDYASIPWTIVTTLPPKPGLGPDGKNPSSAMHGVGPAAFWSISTLRKVQVRDSDGRQQEHYLYKIFTPGPLNQTFIADLFDIPPPSTPFADSLAAYNGKQQQQQQQQQPDLITTSHSAFPAKDISYLFTKKWTYAYPYAFPRPSPQHEQDVFPPLNLDGASLYYTAGIEPLISTMETAALMGRNIAALILRQI